MPGPTSILAGDPLGLLTSSFAPCHLSPVTCQRTEKVPSQSNYSSIKWWVGCVDLMAVDRGKAYFRSWIVVTLSWFSSYFWFKNKVVIMLGIFSFWYYLNEGNNWNNDDVNTPRKFKISTNLSWNFKAMGFAAPSTEEQNFWDHLWFCIFCQKNVVALVGFIFVIIIITTAPCQVASLAVSSESGSDHPLSTFPTLSMHSIPNT